MILSKNNKYQHSSCQIIIFSQYKKVKNMKNDFVCSLKNTHSTQDKSSFLIYQILFVEKQQKIKLNVIFFFLIYLLNFLIPSIFFFYCILLNQGKMQLKLSIVFVLLAVSGMCQDAVSLTTVPNYHSQGQVVVNQPLPAFSFVNSSFTDSIYSYVVIGSHYINSSIVQCLFDSCTFDHFQIMNSELHGIIFTNNQMIEAKFMEIIASYVTFMLVDLEESAFSDMHLEYASLTNVTFAESSFSHVFFAFCNFLNVDFEAASFVNHDFAASNFNLVSFENAYFENVNIDHISDWSLVNFKGASFKNVTINGQKVKDTEVLEGETPQFEDVPMAEDSQGEETGENSANTEEAGDEGAMAGSMTEGSVEENGDQGNGDKGQEQGMENSMSAEQASPEPSGASGIEIINDSN